MWPLILKSPLLAYTGHVENVWSMKLKMEHVRQAAVILPPSDSHFSCHTEHADVCHRHTLSDPASTVLQ